MNDPDIMIDGVFTNGFTNKGNTCKNKGFDNPYSGEFFYAGGNLRNCGIRPIKLQPRFYGKKGAERYRVENENYNKCIEANRQANIANKAVIPETTIPADDPTSSPPIIPDLGIGSGSGEGAGSKVGLGADLPSDAAGGWVGLSKPLKIGIIAGGVVVVGTVIWMAFR